MVGHGAHKEAVTAGNCKGDGGLIGQSKALLTDSDWRSGQLE